MADRVIEDPSHGREPLRIAGRVERKFERRSRKVSVAIDVPYEPLGKPWPPGQG